MNVVGDNFLPVRSAVTNVTVEATPTVTTATDHALVAGQYINLHVPLAYHMHVPNVQGRVISAPTTTTFVCDITTRNQPAFVTPTAPPAFTQAFVVPVSGLWINLNSITGPSGAL